MSRNTPELYDNSLKNLLKLIDEVKAEIPKMRKLGFEKIEVSCAGGENDARDQTFITKDGIREEVPEEDGYGGFIWEFNAFSCVHGPRIVILTIENIQTEPSAAVRFYDDIRHWVRILNVPGKVPGLVDRETKEPFVYNRESDEEYPGYDVTVTQNEDGSMSTKHTPNKAMEKLEYAMLPQEGTTRVLEEEIQQIPNYEELVTKTQYGVTSTWIDNIETEKLIPDEEIENMGLEHIVKQPVLTVGLFYAEDLGWLPTDEDVPTEATAQNGLAENDDAIIKTLQSILEGAVAQDATEIHIGSQENLKWVVGFRVYDEMVKSPFELPASFGGPLLTHIKTLAEIDTRYSNIPQTGKFQAQVANVDYGFQVTTYPSPHGEACIIRIEEPR